MAAPSTNYCALLLNILSFAFLMSSNIVGYWTVANALYEGPQGYISTFIAVGPWSAGELGDSFPIPCNCDSSGFCFDLCPASLSPVQWNLITSDMACAPRSQVFVKWSGPLNYCQFPEGFMPPIWNNPNGTNGFPEYNGAGYPVDGVSPANATGWIGDTTPPPVGTIFLVPGLVPAMQGLITAATVLVFIAFFVGLLIDSRVAAVLIFCVLLFNISSYSVWTTFAFSNKLLVDQIGVPVFYEGNQMMFAADTAPSSAMLGASFACVVIGSVLSFFTFAVHMVGIKEEKLKKQSPQLKPSATGTTTTSMPAPERGQDENVAVV